jgi:hypothetical protein
LKKEHEKKEMAPGASRHRQSPRYREDFHILLDSQLIFS